MTAIIKARDKRRKLSDGDDLKVQRNLFKKHLANPSSRKMAIDAFCFHCMGGTKEEMGDSGWRELIRTCTCPDCPLYLHRPYKNKEEHE